GFEMTLLRMLAFRPVDVDASNAGASGPARGTPRAKAAPAPERGGAPAPAASGAATRREASAADSAQSGGGRNGAPPMPWRDIDWPELLRSLDLRGPARQLADHCDLQSHGGGTWQLVLPADKQHLNTQQLRSRIEGALREQLGRELRLNIVAG